jgi:hypothetical protein
MTDELIAEIENLLRVLNRVNALTRQELLNHGFPGVDLFNLEERTFVTKMLLDCDALENAEAIFGDDWNSGTAC